MPSRSTSRGAFLGLLTGLLLASSALATEEATDPVDPILERLAAAYADVPSVEADFVQTSSGMS